MTFMVGTMAFELGICNVTKRLLKRLHRGFVRAQMARAARELDTNGYHKEATAIRNEINSGRTWLGE
jgi:histone acetyltransferase (RNA polymerase elongator complex component)